MCSVAITIVIAFAAQAYAKKLALNHALVVQDPMHTLVNDLLDRALKAWVLHRAELDGTTLGSSSNHSETTTPVGQAIQNIKKSMSAKIQRIYDPIRKKLELRNNVFSLGSACRHLALCGEVRQIDEHSESAGRKEDRQKKDSGLHEFQGVLAQEDRQETPTQGDSRTDIYKPAWRGEQERERRREEQRERDLQLMEQFRSWDARLEEFREERLQEQERDSRMRESWTLERENLLEQERERELEREWQRESRLRDWEQELERERERVKQQDVWLRKWEQELKQERAREPEWEWDSRLREWEHERERERQREQERTLEWAAKAATAAQATTASSRGAIAAAAARIEAARPAIEAANAEAEYVTTNPSKNNPQNLVGESALIKPDDFSPELEMKVKSAQSNPERLEAEAGSDAPAIPSLTKEEERQVEAAADTTTEAPGPTTTQSTLRGASKTLQFPQHGVLASTTSTLLSNPGTTQSPLCDGPAATTSSLRVSPATTTSSLRIGLPTTESFLSGGAATAQSTLVEKVKKNLLNTSSKPCVELFQKVSLNVVSLTAVALIGLGVGGSFIISRVVLARFCSSCRTLALCGEPLLAIWPHS